MSGPEFPVGEFVARADVDAQFRASLINEMEEAPARWQAVVAQVPDTILDSKYRNWTIRQIVHHVADSHTNSYIRFKWTLTENQPRIKAYDEAAWVALKDASELPVEPALRLLEGLHQKWCQLLRSMSEDDFARKFEHPETNAVQSLNEVLQYYPWHSQHHLGQIVWLLNQNGLEIKLDFDPGLAD